MSHKRRCVRDRDAVRFAGNEGDTRISAASVPSSKAWNAMSAPRFIATKTGGLEKERIASRRSSTQWLKLRPGRFP